MVGSKEILSLPLPAETYLPLSELQKQAEEAEYSELLDKVRLHVLPSGICRTGHAGHARQKAWCAGSSLSQGERGENGTGGGLLCELLLQLSAADAQPQPVAIRDVRVCIPREGHSPYQRACEYLLSQAHFCLDLRRKDFRLHIHGHCLQVRRLPGVMVQRVEGRGWVLETESEPHVSLGMGYVDLNVCA